MRIAAVVCLTATATIAAAQVAPVASRTLFLSRGATTINTPMNVAFHPGFNRYYSSNGGNITFAAFVHDSSGNLIQTIPAGIDCRGWMYNPNRGRLEVSTYNPAPNGVREPGLTPTGDLIGSAGTLVLATAPGTAGDQSMFVYDPAADAYLSYQASTTINVVSATSGLLLTQITPDWTAAGVAAAQVADFCLGYDPARQYIIQVDASTDRALVFSRAGAFIGASQLDIDVPTSFRMGFTNGQLFVFDTPRNGWQGFNIYGCRVDLNADGAVDFNDYLEFLNLYNANDIRVDFNGDGAVDFNDYLEFLNLYNTGC